MSGRHSGGTGGGLRISALPQTLKMIFKLAPRQLSDEIALAKAEIKRKGIQLGVAGAFFAVALVFVAFLLVGLVVAAIMGLATIMPAWLAALLVCAVFLVIAAIGALIGLNKFKKLMPLVPEETIRGLKYDLGIAKEGSAFDAAILDPNSEQYKAAKAAKEAAAAKAKAEKEAKAAAKPDFGPPPTEAELRRRVDQRRTHLTGVRDDLGRELDVKTQAQTLLAATQARLQDGKEQLSDKIAGFRSSVRTSAGSSTSADGQGLADTIKQRWKPLAVLAASGAALAVLVRRLLKG
ncbi:phage holin family protein [Arthrobacter sp. 131MFCol6.1]|uniref:phage holin family protein n=1 Tax=Arthrobacter sp. 131MFCol6.1 TaxID=1157944 RepID=UPI000363D67F|nr:phage holin family protein [Arthrobacter sp. 131MFCol6.1]